MNLTWAARRQWMIIGGAVLIGLGILIIVLFSVFYKFPSCTDHKQNQNETGVDCGGSCTYLCAAQVLPLHVSFVRAVSPSPGRTDIIAYIENKNPAAAAHTAHYTLQLYGKDNSLVAEQEGTVDVPPASVVPVFLPGVYAGASPVNRAFLQFDDTVLKWTTDTSVPILPKVSAIQLTGSTAPRVTATLTNPTPTSMRNVKVVATLFVPDDAVLGQLKAIAASQTVLTEIPAQGSSEAVFTWPQPLIATPTTIEVVPVPALPAL